MTVVALAEIADQVRGVSYGKADVVDRPAEGFVPVLRANNITDHGLSFDDLVYVRANKISAKQQVKSGDIVIAASSGSISVVGKAAQAEGDLGMGFGAFCKVVRPSPKVHARYIGHYFTTQEYRKRMSALAAGANINNLKNEHIDEIEIRLPPLDEQKRIAAILDQADELRCKRQLAINRLNQLGQAIFHEMFGDPKMNPHRFPTIALGDLIKVSSGSGLIGSDQKGGEYPVYGGNGVNGWHDDYTVPAGTIVIGRVGVYCGAVHVTDRSSWVTDNALVVALKQPVNQTYLAAALKIADLNQYAGRSAQPLVSGSRIYPIEILKPPNDKQEQYESRIKRFELTRADYSAALQTSNKLFSALQNRAFQGEL
jgi:type I restriction enzyme S subunit